MQAMSRQDRVRRQGDVDRGQQDKQRDGLHPSVTHVAILHRRRRALTREGFVSSRVATAASSGSAPARLRVVEVRLPSSGLLRSGLVDAG